MKFLLDVCVDSVPVREVLTHLGHDVLAARDRCPHASDEVLLALAWREGRILVTEDKDFGELVFLRGLPHWGIVTWKRRCPAEPDRASWQRYATGGDHRCPERARADTCGEKYRVRR